VLPSDKYFLRYLPSHMIKAGMIDDVEAMYEDYIFFETQVNVLGGPVESIEQFLLDVRLMIKLKIVERDRMPQSFRIMTVNLLTMASDIGRWDELKQVVRAFFVLGEALQVLSHWNEAVDVFMHASSICTAAGRGEDDPDMAKVNRLLLNNVIVPLSFVPSNSPDRLRLKYRNELLNSNFSGCNGIPLELESHEGKAICQSAEQHGGSTGCYFYNACIGTIEGALLAKYDGERIEIVERDGCVEGTIIHFPQIVQNMQNRQLANETPVEGMPLIIYNYTLKPNKTARSKYNLGDISSFTIDKEDGSISPKSAPHLVVGTGKLPLNFVSRDSPCRLIFENLHRKNRLYGNDSCGLFPLGRVISHPGKSIICSHTMKVDEIFTSFMGLGSEDEVGEGISLCLRNGQLSLPNGLGLFYLSCGSVRPGEQLLACMPYDPKKRNCVGMFLELMGLFEMQVNDDGSLSPVNAPHFALGTTCLGNANTLVSPELMKEAAAESFPQKQSLRYRLSLAVFSVLVALLPLLIRFKVIVPSKPKAY